jgi:hypothetical protein
MLRCQIGWKDYICWTRRYFGRIDSGLFLDRTNIFFCLERLRKRNVKYQIGYPETWPVPNLVLLDLSSGSLPQHQPDLLRIVGNDDGHADASPINLLVHFSSGRFKCRMLWTYMASHFALWLEHIHVFCSKLSRTTWDMCFEKLPHGSVISHVAYSSSSYISNIEIINLGSSFCETWLNLIWWSYNWNFYTRFGAAI